MPWLASVLSAGQGERTSLADGGVHGGMSWERALVMNVRRMRRRMAMIDNWRGVSLSSGVVRLICFGLESEVVGKRDEAYRARFRGARLRVNVRTLAQCGLFSYATILDYQNKILCF